MRILIATWHRNVVGGTEKYLQAVIPGLLGRGHQVALICQNADTPNQETIDSPLSGMPIWFLENRDRTTVLESIRNWAPDVVYSNGVEAPDFEGSLLNSYPTILFAHNYYGTCGTGSKCHRFPRFQPCSRRFGPMCILLHYPRRCGGLNPRRALEVLRLQLRRKSQLSDFRAILVASSHMQREFLQHGIHPESLYHVPLPTTVCAPPPEPPEHPQPQGRVLFLGRLTELKGVSHLIRAFHEASQKLDYVMTLTIAGEGPEKSRLQHLAHTLGVRAEFLGWVETTSKLNLLRQADLLAVPSLWPEPFGLVGIEAACFGVPSVAYALGGIPDWLVPGQTGELALGIRPTPKSLADAIVRALREPLHYRNLSLGAWRMAQRFTLSAHLDKLEAILTAKM